jgi:hypothetical protein
MALFDDSLQTSQVHEKKKKKKKTENVWGQLTRLSRQSSVAVEFVWFVFDWPGGRPLACIRCRPWDGAREDTGPGLSSFQFVSTFTPWFQYLRYVIMSQSIPWKCYWMLHNTSIWRLDLWRLACGVTRYLHSCLRFILISPRFCVFLSKVMNILCWTSCVLYT